MDLIDIILAIVLVIVLVAYLAYGLIMLKQASRFYKVSKRTVISSIFFVVSSSILILSLIASYIGSVVN